MGFIRISRAALEDRRRGRVLGWGSDFGGGTGGPRSRPWTPTPFSSLYLRARAKGARNALEVPGQLRHSAACRITDEYDIETTRQVLGHATVKMSRHYSQGSETAAKKAAKKIG